MAKFTKYDAVKVSVLIACVALFLSYNEFMDYKHDRESREADISFDTSEINSRLLLVNSEGNGDAFWLVNQPEKAYVAFISFTEPFADKRFGSIAAPGDSIIKHRHSDTLILFKGNRIYYATCWTGKNLR
jgi:hypothetical protein